jgi:hypothetical protein
VIGADFLIALERLRVGKNSSFLREAAILLLTDDFKAAYDVSKGKYL